MQTGTANERELTMRKLLFLLVLFAPMLCLAQQWQVVNSVALFSQNQAVQQTTLVTPSQSGLYRISMYFSVSSGVDVSPEAYFDTTITGQDVTGLPNVIDVGLSCKRTLFESVPTQNVALKAGVPLTYTVSTMGIPGSCTYNLGIVVEQLVQSNQSH